MALFFDAEWFDARIAASGLTHATVARAMGLNEGDLAEMWKDQRELSSPDVRRLASLLGRSVDEIAQHAGIATPNPAQTCDAGDIAARLERIEHLLIGIRERLERGG